MSEQKKPREYALTGLHLTIGNADNPDAEIRIATLLKPNTTITGDIVKVIEYQAYEAAQKRISELEDAVVPTFNKIVQLENDNAELKDEYLNLKSKSDKLRDKVIHYAENGMIENYTEEDGLSDSIAEYDAKEGE